MKHALPYLPYELEALEPHLSRETLDFHLNKHHQGYLDKLNHLIIGSLYEAMPLEQIVREADGAIYNNAAQSWNHTLYFLGLSPKPLSEPKGTLRSAIERDLGPIETLYKEFNEAALSLFGSGWVFLCKDSEGKLSIHSGSNAYNPMIAGLTPLMCMDVWEHAYYIDFRNRRSDYIDAFWRVFDWGTAEEHYAM